MTTLKHIGWLLWGLTLCGLLLLADVMAEAGYALERWSSAQMKRVQRAVGRKA